MLIVVDVESDGPCPGLYSMISFGAVAVSPGLSETFLGRVAPLAGAGRLEAAAAISGISRTQHEAQEDPAFVMIRFAQWIQEVTPPGERPIFVSDNPAFDWQWINYYFHKYQGENPFGFSARRIGDLYSGLTKNYRASWKHLRKTTHDHNPVNDAKGNAEALVRMFEEFNVKL